MTENEIKRRLRNLQRRIIIRTESDKRDFEALELVLAKLTTEMPEEKIDQITSKIKNVILNGGIYINRAEHEEESDDQRAAVPELLDIICSLHNELYREIKGQYYDYMFHWANLGWMGSIDDGLFKEKKSPSEDQMEKGRKVVKWLMQGMEEGKKMKEQEDENGQNTRQ